MDRPGTFVAAINRSIAAQTDGDGVLGRPHHQGLLTEDDLARLDVSVGQDVVSKLRAAGDLFNKI